LSLEPQVVLEYFSFKNLTLSFLKEQYSHQLAHLGANLILVSRNQQKLEKVKSDILAKHDIEIHVFPCDLSDGFTFLFYFISTNLQQRRQGLNSSIKLHKRKTLVLTFLSTTLGLVFVSPSSSLGGKERKL
jgi:hypothetical protein